MKAANKMDELVSVTEESLKLLKFDFNKNGSNRLVEFEVFSEESKFIIRIVHLEETENPSAVFGMILPHRQSEATDLSINFQKENSSRTGSSKLIQSVLASLKRKPWKGLGLVESVTAKSLWRRAAQGLD